MFAAKNNIIVKINKDHTAYSIMNPVSGSFDLMNEDEYAMLQKAFDGERVERDFEAYLLERGYAYNSREEHDAAVERAYSAFNDEIANSQIQLMLVPTYGCNLACTYCYQGRGGDSDNAVPVVSGSRPSLITKEVVDAFFEYARKNFSDTHIKPFITLFGGEPLVNSPAQRAIVSYIVDRCAEEGYEFSAVTNGYDFTEFVGMLKKVRVKEIQFTLDGSREIHDSRRGTANGKGTFDKVIAGIGAAVDNGFPVNLRSVVDLENIRDIVNLAEFLDEKGWLDLPPELFKTQIGRNYELFDCYAKPQHLMSQAELWSEFATLSKEYPVLAKFHRPDFKGIRHLVDTGDMYMASFDTCPAAKTEWVFDLNGEIYGCTASCGREEYLLGTFWPEVSLNENAVAAWQKRNVKNIPECRDCKYDVICGGGCGVVAANGNGGNTLAPDCRPVQELIETGVKYYIDEIMQMSGDDQANNPADKSEAGPDCGQADEPENEAAACTCCAPAPESTENKPVINVCCAPKKTEGCLICGSELVYTSGAVKKEFCVICGREFESNVKCKNGHYVCDACHRSDILEKVEKLLQSSMENNPVKLAKKVFGLAGLNMHGPEYHSIVPAILVAAWQNNSGKKDASKIREAIRRGTDIKGGSCGFGGNCGAGVGAGIAVSIIEGATPMSGVGRSAANRATGQALIDISMNVGPRCCKREAVTSIESFMKSTDYFAGFSGTKYICSQYGKNKDCIHQRCPYFPSAKQA
ncbi:MAG TPA: DUF5714 domain-containing protein [Clostridia bacterium]|nr:DUF5714 domain-containing protein [Clostridia bacterium]